MLNINKQIFQTNAGSGLSQARHTQSADGVHFHGLSRNRVWLKAPPQTGTEPDPTLHGLNHMFIGQTTQNQFQRFPNA